MDLIPKLKTFDDLLNSNYITKNKLLKLVDLGNISRQQTETKKSLVTKILYESIYGLDEILNILFGVNDLKRICKALDFENVGSNKNNLIGLVIRALPTKDKRKIETVIEENTEEHESVQKVSAVLAEFMLKKTKRTFVNSSPLFSIASMVFLKVAGSESRTIAAISC